MKTIIFSYSENNLRRHGLPFIPLDEPMPYVIYLKEINAFSFVDKNISEYVNKIKLIEENYLRVKGIVMPHYYTH